MYSHLVGENRCCVSKEANEPVLDLSATENVNLQCYAPREVHHISISKISLLWWDYLEGGSK